MSFTLRLLAAHLRPREMGTQVRQSFITWLAPGVVAAAAASFLFSLLYFLRLAVGPDGENWRAHTGGSLSEDLTASVMILVFIAVPTIIVLGNVAASAMARLRPMVDSWRLAGVLPIIGSVVVTAMLVLDTLAFGTVGALLALPFLPVTTGLIVRMAGGNPEIVSFTADPLTLTGTVATVGIVCLLAAIKPAVVVGRMSPAAGLNVSESVSARPRVLRALAVIVLLAITVAAVIPLLTAGEQRNLESELNDMLTSGMLLIILMVTAGPWLYPSVLQVFGALIPRRFFPSFYLSHRHLVANPDWLARLVNPLLTGGGIVVCFAMITNKVRQAAELTGETVNLVDTIVLLSPSVVLGIVGAIGHLLLSGPQLTEQIGRMKMAGLTPGGALRFQLILGLGSLLVVTLLLGLLAITLT